MDINSNLTNQCSGCNQSQNIEVANKSTKQSPQEGRHKFNVETFSREKNQDLEINISRIVYKIYSQFLYLGLYLDLRTVVVLAQNPLIRLPPCTILLTWSLRTLSVKMNYLLQESRINKYLLEHSFRTISQWL